MLILTGDNLFDEPAPTGGAEEEENTPFGKRGGLFSSSGGGLFEDDKEEEVRIQFFFTVNLFSLIEIIATVIKAFFLILCGMFKTTLKKCFNR